MMAGNQGHNAVAGRSGFQPVSLPAVSRSSAPSPQGGLDGGGCEFSAFESADPPIRLGLSDAPVMAARLAASGIVSRPAAEALTVAERDRILDIGAWGGREDESWAEVLAGLPVADPAFDAARAHWAAKVGGLVAAAAAFETATGWKVESVAVNDFHEASARIISPGGEAFIAGYDSDRLTIVGEWCTPLPHAERLAVAVVEEPARELLGPVWSTYQAFGLFGLDEVNRRFDARRAG